MVKTKDRKKGTRHRGSHTHGRGAKKKARGSGHRGGIGKAGSGKRGDHKKDMSNKRKKKGYFGKDKIRRAASKVVIKSVSLERINDGIESFVKKGLAKKTGESYDFNLRGFKIIGDSKFNIKARIHARAASKNALKSVKEAGGEIIIEVRKKIVEGKKEGKEKKATTFRKG